MSIVHGNAALYHALILLRPAPPPPSPGGRNCGNAVHAVRSFGCRQILAPQLPFGGKALILPFCRSPASPLPLLATLVLFPLPRCYLTIGSKSTHYTPGGLSGAHHHQFSGPQAQGAEVGLGRGWGGGGCALHHRAPPQPKRKHKEASDCAIDAFSVTPPLSERPRHSRPLRPSVLGRAPCVVPQAPPFAPAVEVRGFLVPPTSVLGCGGRAQAKRDGISGAALLLAVMGTPRCTGRSLGHLQRRDLWWNME